MRRSFAIIVAAGRGQRVGGDLPKQYQSLGGRAVLRHSVEALLAHSGITGVLVVIGPGDEALYARAVAGLRGEKLRPPATGGETRQESVRNGLGVLAAGQDDIVLIHDAARPFITPELISRAIETAAAHGAGVPTLAVADTLKRVEADGVVAATIDRGGLHFVQTPQSFTWPVISEAHERAREAGRRDFTDDAGVCEWAGRTVYAFEGEANSFKITTAADLGRAERMLSTMARTETRTATGYDVHALGDGDHVWLCGVRIPHDAGLIGHSDADPVLHALTDAILGALGDGDIGVHFPPSDPQWKGATSTIFLKDAVRRVRERGGRIVHLDATVVCEAPRIGAHRAAMRTCVAEAAGITLDRVGLKATTSEKLGFTGRREGIAALATATLELPA